MPKIQAIAPTIIRSEKDPKLEINIKKNQQIAVVEVFPANGQMMVARLGGWLGCLISGDLISIYRPHWNSDRWSKDIFSAVDVKLDVPYYAQCDTRPDGYRFCFSHAVAMAAAYLQKDFESRAKTLKYDQPEQRHIARVELHGDTTDPQAQLAALADIGIDAYFTQTLSPKDLYRLVVELQVPIPVGCAYRESGHWVTVVGYNSKGWLVHDPYGARNGCTNEYFCNSTDSGREGAFDLYSQEAMDAIFWDARTDDDRECGWAIVIAKVGNEQVAPYGL